MTHAYSGITCCSWTVFVNDTWLVFSNMGPGRPALILILSCRSGLTLYCILKITNLGKFGDYEKSVSIFQPSETAVKNKIFHIFFRFLSLGVKYKASRKNSFSTYNTIQKMDIFRFSALYMAH